MRERTKIGTGYIVVPCYNEEEAIETSASRLLVKLDDLKKKGLISEKSKIVFVDDGSKDKTWELIEKLYNEHDEIKALRFAHNRGHQNAILAGMMYSREYADFTITIDADLQQDIEAMDLFIGEYNKGNEIVYGVRNDRGTDSFFKKFTATAFYKLMAFLGANIYENSADYRLMSKKALDALAEYDEVNLFLRGLIPDIGLQSSVVHFEVFERMQGKSKYTFKKMFTLAADGITSFSVKPIRMVFSVGCISILVAFIMFVHVIYEWARGNVVGGWSSIMVSIWALGGAILLALGIIGEYIGRDYMETKHRPRYYFWDVLDKDKKDE